MRPLRSARPPDSRAEEPVTTKELAELMLKGPATATAPGSRSGTGSLGELPILQTLKC